MSLDWGSQQTPLMSQLYGSIIQAYYYYYYYYLAYKTVLLSGFFSRVSTLTRDVDIAILSVRLSVCLSVSP